MKELTEVILNLLLSFGYDKTFTHTVILSMMRLYHRSTLIGDRRTRKSETRVINSSRLRRRGEHSTADLYSPFRAINLTTFDPVSLSVCQECRPSCRASRPMIDHPSRSVLSAVRYRSFAAIDVDLDFGRCSTFVFELPTEELQLSCPWIDDKMVQKRKRNIRDSIEISCTNHLVIEKYSNRRSTRFLTSDCFSGGRLIFHSTFIFEQFTPILPGICRFLYRSFQCELKREYSAIIVP